MNTASIKVSASVLLEKVRTYRQEALDSYAREMIEYEKAEKEQTRRIRAAVKHPDLENVEFDDVYRNGRRQNFILLPVDFAPLQAPSRPSLSSVEKDIALLELAGEQGVTVRSDSNWAKYL